MEWFWCNINVIPVDFSLLQVEVEIEVQVELFQFVYYLWPIKNMFKTWFFIINLVARPRAGHYYRASQARQQQIVLTH